MGLRLEPVTQAITIARYALDLTDEQNRNLSGQFPERVPCFLSAIPRMTHQRFFTRRIVLENERDERRARIWIGTTLRLTGVDAFFSHRRRPLDEAMEPGSTP